jgi:hypothetical protein
VAAQLVRRNPLAPHTHIQLHNQSPVVHENAAAKGNKGAVPSGARCCRRLRLGRRGTPKLRREDLVLLGELATTGAIRPVIDRTYALADNVDATSYVDMGHKRGNAAITVPWRVNGSGGEVEENS